MREMILARIDEMRFTFEGSKRLFGKPNRAGRLTGPGQHYLLDYDFTALSDQDLLGEFEQFVRLSYRHWDEG